MQVPEAMSEPAKELSEERAQLAQEVDGALRRGEFAKGREQALHALGRFEAIPDQEGLALVHFLLGKCYRRLNDPSASLDHHERSYRLYQALGDTKNGADVLMAKSGTLRILGRDQEAIQDLQQSRAIYRELGERTQEMRSAMNLSVLYKQCGDVATSQELLYECLPFFEESGNVTDTAKVLLNIATNYNVLDNPAQAIPYAQRGIPLFESTGDLHYLSMARCVLGSAYLKQGNYDAALPEFRTALRLAEEVGITWTIAIILEDVARVLIHLKHFDEARDVLERGIRINGCDDNKNVYGANIEQLGRLYMHPEYAEHDTRKALECLEEARQIAVELDSIVLLVSVHKALTELHEARGSYKQALECHRAYYDAQMRLFNEESDKRIKRLEMEKAHRDAQIAQLRAAELAKVLDETEQLRVLADEWARTDALTGVPNRRALDERLADEFARSRQYGQPFAVALVDIDHFKQINDTLGHNVGDKALHHVAQILKTHCRTGDMVARYGGEEFALLFLETDLPNAIALCERLREYIATEDWTRVDPGLSGVTISVGVGVFEKATEGKSSSPRELLAVADQNLYQAKHEGRNRVLPSSR